MEYGEVRATSPLSLNSTREHAHSIRSTRRDSTESKSCYSRVQSLRVKKGVQLRGTKSDATP